MACKQQVIESHRRVEVNLGLVLLIHTLDEDVELRGEIIVGAAHHTEILAPVVKG